MKQPTMPTISVRDELRIGDETHFADLLPLSQPVPGDKIVPGMAGFFLGQSERGNPLSPKQIELAQTSVGLYRTGKMILGAKTGQEGLGEHSALVGNVRVSQTGPKGRYMVNFVTTHGMGPEDTQTQSSTYLFDETVGDLDHTYPARRENWVVGRQTEDGPIEVIGSHGDLYDETGGKVSAKLQSEGWVDMAEVWAGDVDRHAGFLGEQ